MLGRNLPPTGNPIALAPASSELPQLPPGYRALWVNSGTAALALALMVARLRHPHIFEPEVILPGYACPDLVAAARFAGMRAVLADIGGADPGYDLASLQSVLGANTAAVVAVNFLGIGERLSTLRELLRPWPQISLIEDNAQWLPEPFAAAELSGDSVCISFGRGKPVSLLGGGALLLREEMLSKTASPIELAQSLISAAPTAQRFFATKVRLYNLLSQPYLYGAISRNPLLQLGQTTFKPLAAVLTMDRRRQLLLRTNIERYTAQSGTAAALLDAGLAPAKNLPSQLSERRARLLRYPVLCNDARERDGLWQRLQQAGLGATALYQRILPEVAGVGDQVQARVPLTGARIFADRLLTLPVHTGVNAKDVARMLEILHAG